MPDGSKVCLRPLVRRISASLCGSNGSTATGEAVLMAHRVTRRRKAVLSGGLHPHYREVVETLPDDYLVDRAPLMSN